LTHQSYASESGLGDELGALCRRRHPGPHRQQQQFYQPGPSVPHAFAFLGILLGHSRGSISRDGLCVVFDSNFDISNTGLPNYADIYLSKVH
jgi:hypothetical protein